ncbi:hypothetical protein KEM52_002546 [Ascosphaera acerosa]|nr:hypothetical protein KEM52_002546 [Ascosphaera acerosa]
MDAATPTTATAADGTVTADPMPPASGTGVPVKAEVEAEAEAMTHTAPSPTQPQPQTQADDRQEAATTTTTTTATATVTSPSTSTSPAARSSDDDAHDTAPGDGNKRQKRAEEFQKRRTALGRKHGTESGTCRSQQAESEAEATPALSHVVTRSMARKQRLLEEQKRQQQIETQQHPKVGKEEEEEDREKERESSTTVSTRAKSAGSRLISKMSLRSAGSKDNHSPPQPPPQPEEVEARHAHAVASSRTTMGYCLGRSVSTRLTEIAAPARTAQPPHSPPAGAMPPASLVEVFDSPCEQAPAGSSGIEIVHRDGEAAPGYSLNEASDLDDGDDAYDDDDDDDDDDYDDDPDATRLLMGEIDDDFQLPLPAL